MKKLWFIIVGTVLLLAIVVPVSAEGEDYYVTGSVAVAGGGQRVSENFSLQDLIGVPVVGSSESEVFHIESGSPEHNPLNSPPVADAGGPYLVAAGGTIPLDGSGSSDPDGDPLTYHPWVQSPILGTFAYDQEYENPTYTAGNTAGIAGLTLTVGDGILEDSYTTMVVVYDPSAGFVTGGGCINSPLGAYVADPTLTGKASFGFVCKYKKGNSEPTGNTEFQFKAGDLKFHSDSYDWLVIAGHEAMYKGSGTINGAGNYGFMLSAIDEELTPSTDVDTLRIKIWDKDNGDAVVYDNQMGAADDADPDTAIQGGSIVIHKGN